jgi:hypothetical protein
MFLYCGGGGGAIFIYMRLNYGKYQLSRQDLLAGRQMDIDYSRANQINYQ